jgi:putative methionine-R-sulfoxide reductase with GAF domain
MIYTVVAICADSGQAHVTQVVANDARNAAGRARDNAEASICVLCIFEGAHNDLHGADEFMEVC